MTIKVLGIDLGKRCFHIYGVDSTGHSVIRQKLNRQGLLRYLSNLPACLIGFEACGGAHYWAAKAVSMGHQAKLMPAQYVKPYVKSNKNDYLDAEAICEAVQRPNMRFVTIRTPEQQALGAMVKLRSKWVAQRTSVINQVHGFLLECGIEYPKGRKTLKRLVELLSQEGQEIPELMRTILRKLYDEYCYLDEVINDLEKELGSRVKQDECGNRLLAIPGVGVITAACLLSWVGDAKHFKSGRALAAWIGLVPKQYTTGGKPKLVGIGKRGHPQLRCNLIHGARSALTWHIDKPSSWQDWAIKLLREKPRSVVVVALANKLARMIWVILSRGESYHAMA